MKNFECWRLYTDGLVSPDLYIDFGFYYIISAALQRRVWIGPPHSPLYPNLYTILVGDPGVGKGLVIKQVSEILHFHKMPDPNTLQKKLEKFNSEDKAVVEAMAEADYRLALESEGALEKAKDKKFQSLEKPLLFPVAADATTYEALVKAMSKALRRINHTEYDETLKRELTKPYTHSSLCFVLEEIASLFRKKTEDVVNFLIQAYDCGDYTYDTKTQGKDRIKKCCLNIFGGTTPGFMQETFDDRLLTEGFASRTFFIFATQNRKTELFIPDLTPEQKDAYVSILSHIEKLSHLYGRVNVKPEDTEWLREWWKSSQLKRPNTNLKLNPYYARKGIHIQKLAMAIHFADRLDFNIERESFEKAINMLAEAEKSMHFALGLDSTNPLSVPAKKIVKYIECNGAQTLKDLAVEFWDHLPRPDEDLDNIISYLQASGKLKRINFNRGSLMLSGYDVLRTERL